MDTDGEDRDANVMETKVSQKCCNFITWIRIKSLCVEYIVEAPEKNHGRTGDKTCFNNGDTVENGGGLHLDRSSLTSSALVDDIVSPEYQYVNRRTAKQKIFALIIPSLVFNSGWLAVMISWNIWYIFPDKYYMSIAMIFGALLCGMTGMAGGVVAFPVMTLAFSILPTVARDFTLMIQTFGMSSATFAIVYMKIPCETSVLIWCTLGGSMGLIGGFYGIDPYLSASQKKMAFASLWLAFAFALVIMNRRTNRLTFNNISAINKKTIGVLFFTGIAGGIFTSFSGCGLDFCSFSIITLLYRVSEKVAIPTAIVLMATNSILGFFWRGLIQLDIDKESWEFLMVCLPIVTLFAPIGSVIGSHVRRRALSYLICLANVIAFISAVVIVQQTVILVVITVSIVVVGFIIFYSFIKLGDWMMCNNMVGNNDHLTMDQDVETC